MTSGPGEDRPILVVDDDEEILGLISMALRRASFAPVSASSGEEALALIDTVRPAVVLLDMTLPGMSGIDVIRALRQRTGRSTLPILLMTGSGDDDTVLRALAAGADDFLAKPVRLDELVARIEAHIRTQQAWSQQLEAELRARADVVGAIGRLTLPADRHEAAAALVQELGQAAGEGFVAILHLVSPGRCDLLATYAPSAGVEHGGTLSPSDGRYVMTRAAEGPWVELAGSPDARRWMPESWTPHITVAACAPIHTGARIVGLLVIGSDAATLPPSGPPLRLLAEVIDYANIVSAAAGSALDQQGRTAGTRERFQRILSERAYSPVFQPIMDLRDRRPVGFEALTRFTDGSAPDVRFAEAAVHELGLDFEAATLQTAIEESRRLPADAFLALNVSPDLVLEVGAAGAAAGDDDRPVVLELTEHAPIDDYAALRTALEGLRRDLRVAVDDAGAGFASLRHILELRPQFVKLDLEHRARDRGRPAASGPRRRAGLFRRADRLRTDRRGHRDRG